MGSGHKTAGGTKRPSKGLANTLLREAESTPVPPGHGVDGEPPEVSRLKPSWPRYIGRCVSSGHPTTDATRQQGCSPKDLIVFCGKIQPPLLEYVPCRRLVAGGVNKVRPAGLRPPPVCPDFSEITGRRSLRPQRFLPSCQEADLTIKMPWTCAPRWDGRTQQCLRALCE